MRGYQAHELEALQQLAVLVLEAMGLVDDDAAPVDGVELRAAPQDHLERRDDRLELVGAPHHSTLDTTLRWSFLNPKQWQQKQGNVAMINTGKRPSCRAGRYGLKVISRYFQAECCYKIYQYLLTQ